MIYLYTALIIFILGIFTAYYKGFSYFMATIASTFAFIAAISSLKISISSNPLIIFKGVYLQIGLDHLTSIFLMIASISWIAISFYSSDYGKVYSKKMPLFMNIVFFSMTIVLTSKDSISFLMGWETATIFLYLLIMENKDSFKQAFKFLAFGEFSITSLVIAFALLYLNTGSFGFLNGHVGDVALFIATLGFITKMDIYPFHTWITKTYPKSPSNVAAILSAPLTLMSAYGLMRILYLSNQPEWWGIMAMLLGGFSAFWGGLQATASKELKLLPAYSTVENNGMILASIGLAVTAYNANINVLMNFATLTAIILIFAHTITKTLLFLSIGHAKLALKEDNIDNVRGIWSSVGKIPAIALLVSTLSFSAFPPFIGFLGEWMNLEGLFQSYKFPSMIERLSAAFSGILIALAMGLAAFSMVKLAGYTALGYDHERKAKKISCKTMQITETILILVVGLVGLFSPLFIKYIGYGQFLSGLLGVLNPYLVVSSHPIFGVVSPTFLTIVVLVLAIFPFSFYFYRRSNVRKVNAWNGGEILKENEYFTVAAYSFILEYILRKVYATKEVKKDSKRFVSLKDVTDRLYDGITIGVRAISKAVSVVLMNGHIYYYILYTMIMFVLIFFMIR